MQTKRPELLVVLIDAAPGTWDLDQWYETLTFQDILETLCVLFNAHLLPEHRYLSVFATGVQGPRLVYKALGEVSPSPKTTLTSVFEGLMKLQQGQDAHSLPRSLTGCLMHIHSTGLPGRVMLLKGVAELDLADVAPSIQTALRMKAQGVLLDVLDIGHTDRSRQDIRHADSALSTLAYVSGGLYYSLADTQLPEGLSERAWLQTVLLRHFAVPSSQRRIFMAPPIRSIECMPVCSVPGCPCGNDPVSIGFACSRCLAVMCHVADRCPRCGARLVPCRHGQNDVLYRMITATP